MQIKSGEVYEAQTFDGLSLDEQSIHEVEFIECRFTNCSFRETRFDACKFEDCTFEGCELSLMTVNGNVFKAVVFRKSKLVGVNWTQAAWGDAKVASLSEPIELHECSIKYALFMGLNLERIRIEDCSALEADFSEANLAGANLRGTDLAKAIFRNSNLSGANLVGAKNYFIDPNLNDISKARFSLPEAMSLLYGLDIEIVNSEE